MQFWQANLNIIKNRWPTLAEDLRLNVSYDLSVQYAKSGSIVPIVNEKPLHSLYDPVKEAQKLIQEHSESFLFVGLGAGYLPQVALNNKNCPLILIIEPKIQLLKKLLANINYTEILSNPKVVLICNDNVSLVFQYINYYYQPLIHGNLSFVVPRIFVEIYSHFYETFLSTWQKWLHDLSGELSTWGHFGKRWLKNIIYNISKLTPDCKFSLPQASHILVAGAGPTLETAIPYFKKSISKNAMVIACDASVSTLLAFNIVPDIIVSIDAQIIVNYHFLGLEIQNSTLISDLSIHPSVHRNKDQVFFAGSHPLSKLTKLRHIPTTSGNVGTVAYELAKILKPQKIDYAGLDFCYIKGKPYARYNYLYSFYSSFATRCNPISHEIVNLTFRSPSTQYDAKKQTYQSDLLSFYKQKFIKSISQPVEIDTNWSNEEINGISFLQWYKKQIQQLPVANIINFHKLTNHEKIIFYTLLPSAFSGYRKNLAVSTLIEENIFFALSHIKNVL